MGRHERVAWGNYSAGRRKLDKACTVSDLIIWWGIRGNQRAALRRTRSARRDPLPWLRTCIKRLRAVRDKLKSEFVGLNDHRGKFLLDWLEAAAIARENVLMLGVPGVAKSEIVNRFYQLLGLKSPTVSLMKKLPPALENETLEQTWDRYEKIRLITREEHKHFSYLLTRFTQPDELLGPVDIMLLRKGVIVRCNQALMTGPGVRAVFLDECFKASSAILNTLLTAINERRYFQWGAMLPMDLIIVVGASNEMPGGFASGTVAGTGTGEDFHLLYAFLDRFTLRLDIPLASGVAPEFGNLGKALDLALGREGKNFSEGRRFDTTALASINDVLLAGRACMQHWGAENAEKALASSPFSGEAAFRRAFLGVASSLQLENTSPALGRLRWTISPRKLKALYKIALAHALLNDKNFAEQPAATQVNGLGADQLHVFDLIWDTPTAADDLRVRLEHDIAGYYVETRR